MADISVNLNLKSKPAIYTPSVDRPRWGLKKNTPVNVDVYGIYQVCDGEDVNAYFVAELPDGRCIYAGVEDVQFTFEGWVQYDRGDYDATDKH